ncbi:DNA polymerase III subunit delta [Mesorhizobium sp. KR9-304]|uniref:DNA polymerase III subunit delta n=1 Tax=Mesorhizobium sp. KR9-304 TaxID=3156614 RepID=UPI0032B32BD0
MAQKKAHEVEGWLRRPPENVLIVLIYGPDRGLVSERAKAFAEKTGLPLDDPFSVVRLDAGEAERDQGRLLDEARTVPMFSSRRLLWVRNAGAQKSLADDVKALSAAPPRDAVILIEAGDLKKGAPLRSAVETSAIGMALPCYGDEDRDIDSVIDDELAKTAIGIAMEARNALRRNLGGDRLATRGEIAKLALYAHGKREIELNDVLAMTGDVSGISLDDAVDAMLDGKIDAFDQAFSRQALGGSQAYLVLAAAIRQMQSLHLMRASMTGRNAAAAVAAARPPVFFARRKLVERALDRWSTEALQRGLARLQTAVLATRQRPELSVEIARQALLGIAVEGARLGQRR